MKLIFFSLLLLVLTSLEAQAQSCKSPCPYYNDFVRIAQADTVKNTQTKLNYYRAAIVAAKDCHCPQLEQNANKQIDTLFILIEEEKRKAEAQSQTILEQKNEIKLALREAEAANEKNLKIINAMDFYDGKFALALKNGKYGFIDKDGNPKLSFEYDKGEPFDPKTGFAEMEITKNYGYEYIKYLVDTTGNRYQLVDISEVLRAEGLVKSTLSKQDVKALKSKLTSSAEDEELLSKLKGIELGLVLLSSELEYNLNLSNEKLALDFSKIEKDDALSILQNLSKNNEIKDRVEILFFEDMDLDTFPGSIVEFKNLRKIDISWTSIESLPENIDRLKYLKILKLPTGLDNVPSSIYNLRNLEVLNLEDTDEIIIPEMIGNLKKLKELYLPLFSENIPFSLYSLESLEILDAGFSSETMVPEAIGNLKNLKELHLPKSLEKIPSSIYDLEKLEILSLNSTTETRIPADISKLKKLKELSLPWSLEKFPKDIYTLKNLERLEVYSEGLKELPEGISELKKLKELYLPESLEFFSSSIYTLENLEILEIYSEELKELPVGISNLKKLKQLSLPKSLEKLPKGISDLKNLNKLEIMSNIDLKGLPNISKLKNLNLLCIRLHKDENYATNLAILKTLKKRSPNCYFFIKNENEKLIYQSRDPNLLDDL